MKYHFFILIGGFLMMTMCSAVSAEVQKETLPGLTWKIAYDKEGHIAEVIDPGGKATKFFYEFDKKNGLVRQMTRKHSDGTKVTCKYEGVGRCVKMTDEAGTVNYKYDTYDHLTNIRRDGSPQISYTYDTMGRLKSLSLGKNLTIRYFYDFLGRLSRIEIPAGNISYDYLTGQGVLIRRLPNGIRTQMEYLPDGALKSISHISKDNMLLSGFTYSYRPDGLINTVKEWTPREKKVIQYEYDNVRRLSAVADSSAQKNQKIQYEYDKLGNRLSLTVNGQKRCTGQYNRAGQMVGYNSDTCSHDAAGNLTAYGSKNDDLIFEFNSMNLLKSVTTDGVKVEHQYDGDGSLVARTVDNKTTSFVPDPFTDIWRPLLTTNDQGKQTLYVWDGETPLMAISGKETKFFLHDQIGSVRCVANENGKVTEYFAYSPFGAPQQKTEGRDLQPGFSGLFFDPQASVYLTRARVYDPEAGRFLQTDPQHRVPMGSQKDFSIYAYCGGDPVNFVDLTGSVPEPVNPSTWDPILVKDRDVFYPDLPSLDKLFDPQVILDRIEEEIKNKAIETIRESSDIADFLYYIREGVKDNAETMKQTTGATNLGDIYGVGLRLVKQFGEGTFAGLTAGTLLEAKDLYISAYKDARSVINQRASENLVRLPLGVSNQIGAHSIGTAYRDCGRFSMTGNKGFKATGGWKHVDLANQSVTSREAQWEFNNALLHTGARMSGNFYRRETQSVSGETYRRKSVSRSRHHVSHNGAAISKAVDEYNRTGVYDPDKWQNMETASRQNISSPRMLVDVPGVEWKGSARDNDWGTMLDSNKKTIYVRHKGPGKDDWETPKEPDAEIVTLPNKWDVAMAEKHLLPHVKLAFSQDRDVHFVIDINILFARHVSPFPKKSEDEWAAEVENYISKYKPAHYKGILAGHSRGTNINRHIKDFNRYDAVLIASPRGDDALRWINKTDDLPEIYILTGLSDAPAWRWKERLGKLVKKSNVHIIQLQNISNPAETHSRLQNVGTQGKWKLISTEGERKVSAKLRTLLTPVFSTEPSTQKGTSKDRGYRKRRNEYDLPSHSFFGGGGGDDGGGGGGPGGGIGGQGGPSGISPMSPSNVGGIYLRGAGEALKHLGHLKGIAVDEDNGRLVLIAEGERQVDLPRLRMDDVVTIFRSVYEHGEAPFVSIDPMPDDPNGPEMNIRHGAGTANTYVGWILFETDRLMKTYGQGYDNVTWEQVKLDIENYKNHFDIGSSVLGKIWERFWIVPAEVNRRQSTNAQLTLFDVPLKVNTQRMELHQGKLIPAKDDTPSESAKSFSDWFTRSYDEIAENALSTTPKGGGINSRVKVFAELRRIALVTAIAETLRDQGVPMPSWMRNYTVKAFQMPARTPSITVEATSSGQKRVIKSSRTHKLKPPYTRSITGGVNLAPADKDVHVTKGAPEAEKLAPEVSREIASVPTLSPVTFTKNNRQIQAVALPGNDTRDLGANQLTHTDLVVPVWRGTQIALVRKFNSFFQPDGVLGSGWTFDLPRLEKQILPIKRTGDKTEYKTAYQLTSQFNTYSESFREHKFVPEMNGKLLVPEHAGLFLGLADTKDDKIGAPTKALIFRDGRKWHFDESGNFVAQMDKPLTVIYRRDGAQRISRIEGWYGKDLRADIRIEYDKKGRVESAKGSNKAKANYKYDSSGALNRVEILRCDSKGVSEKKNEFQDTIEYAYKDGLVTAITQNKEDIRQFGYGDRGQLLWDQLGDGTKRTYQVSSGRDRVKITASTAKGATSAEYDAAFRPLKRVLEDGTHIQWKYNADDHVEAEIFRPVRIGFFRAINHLPT